MLRSVKLTRVTIQVPEEYLSAVMGILGDLRLLHLIRVEETPMGKLGYVAHVNVEMVNRYDALLARLTRLLEELAITAPPPMIRSIPEPGKLFYQLEEACAANEGHVAEALSLRREQQQTVSAHQELIDQLELLRPLSVRLERLAALRFVCCHVGLVPKEHLERLESSLEAISHTLIPVNHKQGRVVLLAMTLKEDEQVLLQVLKSAFWDPLEIKPELTGTVDEHLERLYREMEQASRQLRALDQEIQSLGRQYGTQLMVLREQVFMARQLLQAQEKFGRIDHTYLLSGWLPRDLFEQLSRKVKNTCSDRAMVEQVAPEEIKEVRSGILSIPVLFNNPALIRPFERLTMLYGTPSYEEVEPTGFLAITFLLLFGMMFGDVGHGLVLSVVGYLVFKKMYSYTDYGIILMESGCAAAVFGLLYGSVFGMDTWIPALWMRPMDNVLYFMQVCGVIGVGMISTGLVLNAVNVLRRRRYAELFSASGLAGALLYWLAAALGIRWYLAGPLSGWEKTAAFAVAGGLVVLMILQRPVLMLLRTKITRKNPAVLQGVGIALLESVIDLFDGLLRYFSSTISFVRVAAFAFAHAGLFMAVFTLADMIRSAQGTGFLYLLILVVGNIIIISLEGLVVSIQTVRLEYYEFFSLFFRGGGKLFQPMFKEKTEQHENEYSRKGG